MKRLASLSFTTTEIDPPAGVTVAGFDANLFLDGTPVGATAHFSDSSAKITFTITAPGAYHVELARVSDTGEAVASPAASDLYVVKPDMIAVPLTVTLSFTDMTVLPPTSALTAPAPFLAASAPPAKSPESAAMAIPPAK